MGGSCLAPPPGDFGLTFVVLPPGDLGREVVLEGDFGLEAPVGGVLGLTPVAPPGRGLVSPREDFRPIVGVPRDGVEDVAPGVFNEVLAPSRLPAAGCGLLTLAALLAAAAFSFTAFALALVGDMLLLGLLSFGGELSSPLIPSSTLSCQWKNHKSLSSFQWSTASCHFSSEIEVAAETSCHRTNTSSNAALR